jgi:hypothetical protein
MLLFSVGEIGPVPQFIEDLIPPCLCRRFPIEVAQRKIGQQRTRVDDDGSWL